MQANPKTRYPVLRALQDDFTIDPAMDPQLTFDEVRRIYRYLVLTRFLDKRLTALQRQGRVGFHVGSLGEEAAIIGATFALDEQDWIFPCYRELGSALMRGLSLQTFIHNMFGTSQDVVQGRQMPNHYTCREKGYASVSSPVGTQITQAVGYAWAAKMDKVDLASISFFGDGATSTPDFHSGMNMAAVFKIPSLFFCRNNGWAISTHTDTQTASETFAQKAEAYGMPGVRVDGNDVFAVIYETRRARERARRGEGPTLIEAITYRMGGHSTSDDPTCYRENEDVDPWKESDPLLRVRGYLEKNEAWSQDEQEALEAEIDRDLKQAVSISESTDAPELSSLFHDVLRDQSWNLKEQEAELLRGPRAPKGH